MLFFLSATIKSLQLILWSLKVPGKWDVWSGFTETSFALSVWRISWADGGGKMAQAQSCSGCQFCSSEGTSAPLCGGIQSSRVTSLWILRGWHIWGLLLLLLSKRVSFEFSVAKNSLERIEELYRKLVNDSRCREHYAVTYFGREQKKLMQME